MEFNSTQYFLSLIQYHTLQMIQQPAQIKISDLRHLIYSKHENLHQIFEVLRMHKYYFIVVRQLLIQIINDVYIQIDEKLQIHIIRCIWKQYILQLLVQPLSERLQDKHQKVIGFDPDLYQKIIMFLCQKMRSLKFSIRLEALNSFFQLMKCIIQNHKVLMSESLSMRSSYQFHKVLVDSLSDMIEKQELVKQVSYSRGIFLQLLQDQYHQLRKQTLALLRQISLHTLYLGSPRSQNILKQTILYMLNDEHQLVREQSLLDIRQISLFQESLNKFQSERIFGKLNNEQVNTILMCLKQNRDRLREECYQCLKWIGFAQIRQIMEVLQKLYQTLLIYKQDKQKIYSLLLHYSFCLKQLMVEQISQNPTFLQTIYQFNGEEEPNPKNIVYKGKILLMSQWYQEINKKLPFYFKRHLNYVRDLEICKLSPKTKKIFQFEEKQIKNHGPNFLSGECEQLLYNSSAQELKAILEIELSVAEGIKKQLFKLLKNLLRIYTLLEHNKNQLQTQFQLQNSDLLTCSLEQSQKDYRKGLIKKILNQNWEKLNQISYTFSIKNHPILLDIISKIGHIWQNLFQDQEIDEVLGNNSQLQQKSQLPYSQEFTQKMDIQQKSKFRYFYNYINFLIKLTMENSFEKVRPYIHKIKPSNTSNQKLMICLQSPIIYYENYWIKIKPQQNLSHQNQSQLKHQWIYIPLMSLKHLTNLTQRPSNFLQDLEISTEIFQLQLKISSKYSNSFSLQNIGQQKVSKANQSKFLRQILIPIKVNFVELIVMMQSKQLSLAEWRISN